MGQKKSLKCKSNLLTDVPVESVLDRCPYRGFWGLAKVAESDIFRMQGVSNPPP